MMQPPLFPTAQPIQPSQELSVRIIGARDRRDSSAVNTCSRREGDWVTDLSPFTLGPIRLYNHISARIFENAWQFTKVYPEHSANNQPTQAYWRWAHNGWKSFRPFRYPMGKGRKPVYSWWDGQTLDYVAARKQVYLPLYRDAVRQTKGFARLTDIYRRDGSITLFDFDGYDHHRLNLSLHQVLNDPTRICGHAFILAMMLIYGADFTPASLTPSAELPPASDAHQSS